MLIVAVTSPLNYLVLIQSEFVLPSLYGAVWIPPAVLDELQALETEDIVKRWSASPPDWLRVRAPNRIVPSLAVDDGEAAAISLALEIHADRLLIDDRDGREVATTLGLQVAGTLAVLRDAAKQRLINLRDAIEKLQRTTFRASPDLYQQILANDPPAERHRES